MDDWQDMQLFALELIRESKPHLDRQELPNGKIMGERIAILHLDHANELLMKSFLIKKGYVVEFLKEKQVEKGTKTDDFIKEAKTLEYEKCLDIITSKEHIPLKRESKTTIIKFHQLRNEIQHRAKYIPDDKRSRIKEFYPCLKELFGLMFPDSTPFPIIHH